MNCVVPLPVVSVVVVNWNGQHHLNDCLGSLISQDYPHKEILLVDNGSTDSSVDFVEQHFPDVRLIRLARNHGFAEANNVGIEASSGELIILINNDTISLPGMITAFVRAMNANPKLGATQGKIHLMRSPDRLDTGVGSFFTNAGFLVHAGHLEPSENYTAPQVIFAGKGACLCLRRSALDRTGLFDPKYFAYFEDSDLCWRIWLAGFTVGFVPDAEILHAMGSSSELGGRADLASFATINFHSFKNRIRTLIKNLGTVRLLLILPAHLLVCAMLIVLYFSCRRAVVAKGIAAAIVWNAVNLPDTLRERRRVQRCVRLVSDEVIFEQTLVPVDITQFSQSFRANGEVLARRRAHRPGLRP
ncbi:MAG: glycosyltransferase family 2 protein [Chloroflexi bacterium]|nr:glycosyltransferase family 2 protein [Chloroflexota bacterium]